MKRDIQVYDYHTTCPNCKGFNTRLNKAVEFYVLCYSCSLLFKPSHEEIEKMKTPLPIRMAIHPSMAGLPDESLTYVKKIYNENSNKQNGEVNELQIELRNASLTSIETHHPKNCLILSQMDNLPMLQYQTTVCKETSVKLIEKFLYQNVLKLGKIDLLILEDVSKIVLLELLERVKDSVSQNGAYIIYSPIFDKVYHDHFNFFKKSDYIYNTYTISHSFEKLQYNIFSYNKLSNFYQYILKLGFNNDKNFNATLKGILNQEMKNIIYSEPLFITS